MWEYFRLHIHVDIWIALYFITVIRITLFYTLLLSEIHLTFEIWLHRHQNFSTHSTQLRLETKDWLEESWWRLHLVFCSHQSLHHEHYPSVFQTSTWPSNWQPHSCPHLSEVQGQKKSVIMTPDCLAWKTSLLLTVKLKTKLPFPIRIPLIKTILVHRLSN